MRRRRNLDSPRRGSSMVEAALILPVFFMFILGMVVIGIGIYRYQQVASLAREGARYASVHGSLYFAASSNNLQASDIYNNAIAPMAIGLIGANLTYQVQWGNSATGSFVWTNWVTSSTSTPTSPTAGGATLYNGVKVTVSYNWTPGMYIPGSINLTSTSVMPMSF
jgi:Flp pilus assembly protein TadG